MMKKHLLTLIAIVGLGVTTFAQNQIANLEGINYQAVAIDDQAHEIVGNDVVGKPLFEKEIGVRFSITDGPSGAVTYYSDEHVTTTDRYGMFSVTIGLGTFVSGDYTALLDIPWINGDQWLMVEISTNNDGNYNEVSYEKFMAVPFAFYTDDIADNSITTWKIVDETIQAIDIDTSAVETSEILDETILAEDIATGAVETSEILDETILAEDIATGAVTTDEILDETILAEDIATGAVTTDEILDGTILNEDIANGTIDLTTKVTGILPVANGGTGIDASGVTDGQLLIGNGTTGGFDLANITAGTGIGIINTPGGIEINSSVSGINSNLAGNVQIGSPGSGPCNGGRELAAGDTWTSPAIPLAGVALGNIMVGSVNDDLKGCMMTTYVRSTNQIEVSIYNGTGSTQCFISNAELRVLIVQ